MLGFYLLLAVFELAIHSFLNSNNSKKKKSSPWAIQYGSLFLFDKEIDLPVIETVAIKKGELAGSHIYSSVSFIGHFCKHFQVPFSVLEEEFNNDGEL